MFDRVSPNGPALSPKRFLLVPTGSDPHPLPIGCWYLGNLAGAGSTHQSPAGEQSSQPTAITPTVNYFDSGFVVGMPGGGAYELRWVYVSHFRNATTVPTIYPQQKLAGSSVHNYHAIFNMNLIDPINFTTPRSHLYEQTIFSDFAFKYSRGTSSCWPCGPTGAGDKNSTRQQKPSSQLKQCGGWPIWVSLASLPPGIITNTRYEHTI